MNELIRKQDAVELLLIAINDGWSPDYAEYKMKALPPVQDEKLERCLFEYINACRTVNCPTPDTTRKDRRDAYAVIKVLQPIFGDVPFAKVKRGEENGTD